MKRGLLIALVLIALFIFLNSDVLGNSVTGDAFKPRFRNLFSRAPSPPVQLPPTANQNPKGWFDKADCSFLGGWACDPNNYAAALGIYFYEGNTVVGKVVANKQRESAVAQQCGGNANHGFLIGTPTSLKDDRQHKIIAKAIDVNTGAQIPLSGNPKTLTCSPSVMVCGGACNNGVCPAEFRGGCSNGVCVDQICTEDDQSVSYKGPGCSNGADDDADGKIDCQDSGCSTATNCFSSYGCGVFCSTTTTTSSNGTATGPTLCANSALTCQNNKCYSSNCQESASANNCNDNLDNDFDNIIDCSDTSCATANNCIESSTLVSSCKDNTDNDLDGQIDCQDSGCATYCSNLGPETFSNNNCADNFDNDGDGLTDCFDPFCGPAINCQETPSNNNCADGIDNDNDKTQLLTTIDCGDSGCYGSSTCQTEYKQANYGSPSYGLCGDGGDNDGDGLTDCKDPDCFVSNGCQEREQRCTNGIDDNQNGAIDAADPVCAFFVKENNGKGCIDGYDNDKNGFGDCLDVACTQSPHCAESGSCWDGMDNDGNGLRDCNDAACLAAGSCGPTEAGFCVDGLDNDRDGLYDCVDVQDCGNDPLCAGSDTDGGGGLTGTTLGKFGQVLIGGVPPIDNYDYCDFTTGQNTLTTPLIREADYLFAFTRGHTMYELAPGQGFLDCRNYNNPATGQPFTSCKNGRCV